MATRIPTPKLRPGRTTPAAPERCPPPCPACGGLKCLCRPRFFAGQLLTEQDLNRLDTYIREKNRLHNRYVHGWGVVCGLEVTCHDCENLVQVSSGYAMSPCGDDVVVCEDATVDVCSLIRQCDREARRPECDPPRPRDRGCDDLEETWLLSICYDEKPSRGITALRAEGCACSRCSGGSGSGGCGCGGSGGGHAHSHSSSGGCGCGGNGNGKAQASTSRVGASAAASTASTQCEPSVICEGYRFQLYRAPEPDLDRDERGRIRGPLVERMMSCIRPYLAWIKGLGSSSGADQTQAQRYRFCCNAKARLRAILLASPRHNCELLADLDAIVCPSPDLDDDSFDAAMDEAGQRVLVIWFQALMACICSGLLPPCPAPSDDNCIPLATVTVRKRDCRILRVCNWTTHRKFATTVPALQYWLSVLPFGRYLREVMETLCCELFEMFVPERDPDQPGTTPNPTTGVPGAAAPDFTMRTADAGSSAGDAGGGAEQKRTGGLGFAGLGLGGLGGAMRFDTEYPQEISTLLAAVVTGRSTPLDPQTLARGLGGVGGKDGPLLRDYERNNLPQYILASQLVEPLLAALVPSDLSNLVGGSSLRSRKGGSGGGGDEVESLRREVAEMKSAMEEQRRTIEQMNQRLGG